MDRRVAVREVEQATDLSVLLSRMGTISFENGDFGDASQLLGQALGLWRAGVGTCDQIAGLAHLLETGRPKSGDWLVTWAAGIGFMWTVTVLQWLL